MIEESHFVLLRFVPWVHSLELVLRFFLYLYFFPQIPDLLSESLEGFPQGLS